MTLDSQLDPTVTIRRAETPEDIDAARDLVRDSFRWAMANVAKGAENGNPAVFANLDAELAGLPGRFGPPSGCLLLARLDGAPAGRVAFYGQSDTTMEIKRMFVRPEAWGHRIGGRLLDRLLAEARAAGYARYVLSTHNALHHAQALYHRAGFHDVPASDEFPGAEPGVAICVEMIPTADAREESHLDR